MAQCDHNAAQIVKSTGGTKSGKFQEEYECPCGAKGWVRGEADAPPQEWKRHGEVFR